MTPEPSLDSALGWSRFLDTLGHELRTPLTAILGYQELLEDGVYGAIEPRGAEAVRRVGSAANELLSLLNGMVDMSRPDDAPPELELAPAPLGPLIEEVAHEGRRLAAERNIAWSDHIPDGLPAIHTDQPRLQRALFLAVLAVLRAAGGGAIELVAAAADDGATVELVGVTMHQLPAPPLRNVVMQRAADDSERSVLRMAIALDTLHRLRCDYKLEDGAPARLRLHLRDCGAPVPPSPASPHGSR